MTFIAGILTVLMVLNCVLLILLVLVQLPKKDAGAGLAFGGGAADALFGAGSGNALTKITKWATGIFFAMALILGLMEDRAHRGNAQGFEQAVEQRQSQSLPAPGAVPAPGTTQPTTVPAPATNAPVLPFVPPGTNSAPATPQPK